MSRYETSDSYLYPDSAVLRNKADIRDQATLDAFEADITTVRILELAKSPIQGRFDLAHLQAIHRHVFQDVFVWAGEIRSVDITRGKSRFANVNQIESYAQIIFGSLAKEACLRNTEPSALPARLAHYMSEINALHPFREGNGRVQRIFIAHLAEELGYLFNYGALSQSEMYRVMEISFFGDEKPLTNLLCNALQKPD